MEGKHYDAIDGLRMIACFGIVMMHVRASCSYDLSGFIYDKVIVTPYDSANFGAYLQAYANMKYLESMGHSVFFVKFRSESQRKKIFFPSGNSAMSKIVNLLRRKYSEDNYLIMSKALDIALALMTIVFCVIQIIYFSALFKVCGIRVKRYVQSVMGALAVIVIATVIIRIVLYRFGIVPNL